MCKPRQLYYYWMVLVCRCCWFFPRIRYYVYYVFKIIWNVTVKVTNEKMTSRHNYCQGSGGVACVIKPDTIVGTRWRWSVRQKSVSCVASPSPTRQTTRLSATVTLIGCHDVILCYCSFLQTVKCISCLHCHVQHFISNETTLRWHFTTPKPTWTLCTILPKLFKAVTKCCQIYCVIRTVSHSYVAPFICTFVDGLE